MNECRAMVAILEELDRAERLHPRWPTDPVHAAAILAEEAGEVIQAANNLKWHGGRVEDVEKEAIQTGAMVLRLLKNLRR